MTGAEEIEWFVSSPKYAPMFTQPNLQSNAVSSVRCEDGTTSGPFGDLEVKGVESFVSELATLGVRQTNMRQDCANVVKCDGTSKDACTAGNHFVELKQNIMDLTKYRCDVFVDPQDGSSDCDPGSMTGVYDKNTKRTTWTWGCLTSDRTMVRKEKTCTLAEFTAYLQAFDGRIDVSMRRMDTAATEVGPAIAGDLRQIVEKYMLEPIDRIAGGVTCGFLGKFYREMVLGLCYQGVSGFRMISQSYNACAILTLFVVGFMYGLWRRALDNVESVGKTKLVDISGASCHNILAMSPDAWMREVCVIRLCFVAAHARPAKHAGTCRPCAHVVAP